MAGIFVLVFICEFERSYYSSDPNYKLFTATQRFFYMSLRPIGMYIMGIFITSVITDFIKVLVVYPRPYFFDENPRFCHEISVNENLTLEERYGLTSFPCHLSTISAFTTFLASCYTHTSVSLHSISLVKPIFCGCFFLLTIAGGIYRVTINYNHWIDVVCGIAIGSFFGYIVNLVLLQSYKSRNQIITENAWKLLLPRATLPKQNGFSHSSEGNTVHSNRSNSRNGRQIRRSSQPYWLSD
ncbi:phospholipid phosphatase-related protein type 4-like isoform X2 [Lycorma delicatula]